MQTFQSKRSGGVYAYEDDVVITTATDGTTTAVSFSGEELSIPNDLVPYVIPAITDAELLAQAQASKLNELSQACTEAIIAGFASDALGIEHTYPSKPIDQTNLIGAVTASQSPTLPSTWVCNFWCADSAGVWEFRPHTAAQIQQVLADGVSVREGMSAKLDGLAKQVMNALDPVAVQEVIW